MAARLAAVGGSDEAVEVRLSILIYRLAIAREPSFGDLVAREKANFTEKGIRKRRGATGGGESALNCDSIVHGEERLAIFVRLVSTAI
jgi:hypothetical protein